MLVLRRVAIARLSCKVANVGRLATRNRTGSVTIFVLIVKLTHGLGTMYDIRVKVVK